MKKIASLTGILLVLMVGASFANGISMSWDDCGALGVADKSLDCATTTAAQFIYGSFVLDAGMNVTSTDNQLDIQVDAATLTAFWNVGTGSGNLGTRFNYDITSPGAACPTFFPPSGATLDNLNARSTTGNRIRLRVAPLLDNVGVNFGPGQQGLAFRLHVIMQDAATDVPGCNMPACFVYNRSNVEDAFNGLNEVITSPLGRNHVTWKGGGAVNCPAATPTQKKTWGSIKALYR